MSSERSSLAAARRPRGVVHCMNGAVVLAAHGPSVEIVSASEAKAECGAAGAALGDVVAPSREARADIRIAWEVRRRRRHPVYCRQVLGRVEAKDAKGRSTPIHARDVGDTRQRCRHGGEIAQLVEREVVCVDGPLIAPDVEGIVDARRALTRRCRVDGIQGGHVLGEGGVGNEDVLVAQALHLVTSRQVAERAQADPVVPGPVRKSQSETAVLVGLGPAVEASVVEADCDVHVLDRLLVGARDRAANDVGLGVSRGGRCSRRRSRRERVLAGGGEGARRLPTVEEDGRQCYDAMVVDTCRTHCGKQEPAPTLSKPYAIPRRTVHCEWRVTPS